MAEFDINNVSNQASTGASTPAQPASAPAKPTIRDIFEKQLKREDLAQYGDDVLAMFDTFNKADENGVKDNIIDQDEYNAYLQQGNPATEEEVSEQVAEKAADEAADEAQSDAKAKQVPPTPETEAVVASSGEVETQDETDESDDAEQPKPDGDCSDFTFTEDELESMFDDHDEPQQTPESAQSGNIPMLTHPTLTPSTFPSRYTPVQKSDVELMRSIIRGDVYEPSLPTRLGTGYTINMPETQLNYDTPDFSMIERLDTRSTYQRVRDGERIHNQSMARKEKSAENNPRVLSMIIDQAKERAKGVDLSKVEVLTDSQISDLVKALAHLQKELNNEGGISDITETLTDLDISYEQILVTFANADDDIREHALRSLMDSVGDPQAIGFIDIEDGASAKDIAKSLIRRAGHKVNEPDFETMSSEHVAELIIGYLDTEFQNQMDILDFNSAFSHEKQRLLSGDFTEYEVTRYGLNELAFKTGHVENGEIDNEKLNEYARKAVMKKHIRTVLDVVRHVLDTGSTEEKQEIIKRLLSDFKDDPEVNQLLAAYGIEAVARQDSDAGSEMAVALSENPGLVTDGDFSVSATNSMLANANGKESEVTSNILINNPGVEETVAVVAKTHYETMSEDDEVSKQKKEEFISGVVAGYQEYFEYLEEHPEVSGLDGSDRVNGANEVPESIRKIKEDILADVIDIMFDGDASKYYEIVESNASGNFGTQKSSSSNMTSSQSGDRAGAGSVTNPVSESGKVLSSYLSTLANSSIPPSQAISNNTSAQPSTGSVDTSSQTSQYSTNSIKEQAARFMESRGIVDITQIDGALFRASNKFMQRMSLPEQIRYVQSEVNKLQNSNDFHTLVENYDLVDPKFKPYVENFFRKAPVRTLVGMLTSGTDQVQKFLWDQGFVVADQIEPYLKPMPKEELDKLSDYSKSKLVDFFAKQNNESIVLRKDPTQNTDLLKFLLDND